MPLGVKSIPKEQRDKISESLKRYFREHPKSENKILLNKYSNAMVGKTHTEDHTRNIVERKYGGFWYGNVKYNSNGKKYCELWTEDLKERIRAYWGYRSVLSGKSSEEIGGKNLACHHVYYQEKACCGWDEDVQGYFAWINIGTYKKRVMYKYYIKGDPNKFVPLTHSEHMETNFNRLVWIKLFEDIIEEQGGKCYFTKKDIDSLTDPTLPRPFNPQH